MSWWLLRDKCAFSALPSTHKPTLPQDAPAQCKIRRENKNNNGNGLWSASLANPAPSEMLEGS